MLFRLSIEEFHRPHGSLAGLAGNSDSNVILRLFLQKGEGNSIFPGPFLHNGIALPIASLKVEGSNFRTDRNACAIMLFVLYVHK